MPSAMAATSTSPSSDAIATTMPQPASAARAQPYVGPRAFQPNEQLYGRERETGELVDLLLAERIVLLYSPSGAGKTSLIQAALIPKLVERSFRVLPVLKVSREPPQELVTADRFNRYAFSVLSQLEETLPAGEQVPAAELASVSLVEYFERRPKQDTDSGVEALIFDQFEEVLTLDANDQAAKKAFFEQLGELLEERTRWALFAMREDFVASLDPYLLPIPTGFSNTLRLDLLDEQAARQAIQLPCRQAGVDFTDLAATQLCDDLRQVQVQQPDGSLTTQLGPYVEPVQLQVVCLRLWESLPAGKTTIEPADLRSNGTVDDTLAGYYAEHVRHIAASQHQAERDIRNWVENQLISPQGVRLQVLMESEHTGKLDKGAIQALEDARLIRAEKRRGAIWYELSHDRLIKPVRDNNAEWFDKNLHPVQRQAALWQKDHSEGLLLSGKLLANAEHWANEPGRELTQVEQEFMKACRKADRAERADRDRQRSLVFGIASIVAILAAVISLGFGIQASNSARQAQAARDTAQVANLQAVAQKQTADVANASAHTQEAAAVNAGVTAVAAKSDSDAQRATADSARATAVAAQQEAENLRATAQFAAATAQGAAVTAQAGQSVVASAFSRQLAAEAQSNLNWNIDIALLISVEAYRVSQTAEARKVLSDAITIGLRRQVVTLPDQLIPDQSSSILSLAFNPDGQLLAWGTQAGAVDVWDMSGQKLVLKSSIDGNANAIAFSADGKTLAAAGHSGIVTLLSLGGTQPTAERMLTSSAISALSPIVSLAYSPDGKYLAAGRVGGAVDLWDAQSTNYLSQLPQFHQNIVWSLAWSAAGDCLAASTGHCLASADEDGKVVIWDTVKWKPWQTLNATNASAVYSVVWSPDGQWLASGGIDGAIRIWDANTGQLDGIPFSQKESAIYRLAVSQNEPLLAAGRAGSTLDLWDVTVPAAPKNAGVLTAHTAAVLAVALSPKAPILASGGVDKTILLWQVLPRADLNQPLDVVACKLATRNLSQEEWRIFFPGVAYHATCPGK